MEISDLIDRPDFMHPSEFREKLQSRFNEANTRIDFLVDEIAAKDAEIERLKEEHANCPPHTGIGDRGWMEECKRAEQKLEALNAFVAAFDDAQATNFKLPEFTVAMNKARAALEE